MSVPKVLTAGEIDCGDNSCHFAPASARGGMRTNGGCRCFENAGFNRGALASAHGMLPELLSLRTQLAESQAEVARLRGALLYVKEQNAAGYISYCGLHLKHEAVIDGALATPSPALEAVRSGQAALLVAQDANNSIRSRVALVEPHYTKSSLAKRDIELALSALNAAFGEAT